MKNLLLLMVFAAGLSASPIAGGSCGSGGTLAEFAALSSPCATGLFDSLLVVGASYSVPESANILISIDLVDNQISRFTYSTTAIFGTYSWTFAPNPASPRFASLLTSTYYIPFLFWSDIGNKSNTLEWHGQAPNLIMYADIQPIPEPSTYALCAAALALLAIRRSKA